MERMIWVTALLPTTDTFTVKGHSYYPGTGTSKSDIILIFTVFLSSSKNVAGYYLIHVMTISLHILCNSLQQLCTNFPKMQEPPQNSRLRKVDTVQGPYWRITNIRHLSTKLFVTGFWHREFGQPCITDWLPNISTLYSVTWTVTLKEMFSAYILLVLPSSILCACLVSLSRIACPLVKYRKIFPLFFTFNTACWAHWYLCR